MRNWNETLDYGGNTLFSKIGWFLDFGLSWRLEISVPNILNDYYYDILIF
jgi:hypothetical protein